MRFTITVASLAAAANAMLIVAPESIFLDASQTLHLDCPGCPVRMPHTGELATSMASHLEMKFDIEQPQGNRLFLNGLELYPRPASDPFAALHVVDMPESARHRKGMMGMMGGDMMRSGSVSGSMMDSTVPLGFSLLIRAVDGNAKHVAIELQVIQVNDVFVPGIPTISMSLALDDTDAITILSIDTANIPISPAAPIDIDVPDHPDHPDHHATTCGSWLCKSIASLEDHWNRWRPHCGTGTGNDAGNDASPQDNPWRMVHHGPGKHSGPPHDKPHHGHHGHHGHDGPGPIQADAPALSSYNRRQRTWRQIMWSVTVHILIPVLIGVIAGLTMSIIGMVVGTFVVHVYRRFFRSSCPHGKISIPAVAVHEEKSSLMDNQEAPPSYEEGTIESADSKV